MLRITLIPVEDAVRVKLEGSLAGAWVEECRAVCERERSNGGRLSLDVSAVRFVDGEGERFLRELAAAGLVARHSGYIAELLGPGSSPGETSSGESSREVAP